MLVVKFLHSFAFTISFKFSDFFFPQDEVTTFDFENGRNSIVPKLQPEIICEPDAPHSDKKYTNTREPEDRR